MTSTCAKCGQPIELLEVATDAFTGVPVKRWCSLEVPYAVCPVPDLRGGTRHQKQLAHNSGRE